MTLTTIYDQFEQQTDLWFYSRLGLPTSSCFKTIMAEGVKKGSASVTRGHYINDLVAELKYGEPVAQYKFRSAYMDRGHEWEPEALQAYIEQTDQPVTKVGFIRDHTLNIGCSPDALIGDDGGVEIKTLMPGLMIRHMRARGVPPEHMAQLQCCMLVTGRSWWDLVLYTRGEMCIEHVGRDAGLQDELKRFLAPFQAELEKAVLEATQEKHTWRALRALRDRQFAERLAEELEEPLSEINLAKAAEDLATPSVSAIAAALAASLEREKFLEEDTE